MNAKPTDPSVAPAVRMTSIEKRFGAVRANRGANLEVRPGEIHALVGENGAGKSTLMRVLSGMYAADGGTIEVSGRTVTGWTTAQAIAGGVGMVHQHFMLVPTLTVAENVVLGREPTSGGTRGREPTGGGTHGRDPLSSGGLRRHSVGFAILDREKARREVEALSTRSGLIVPVDRLVADLSVGEAQRVEILKTLYRGARILLLDEPTAVLSPPEVDELWTVLRRVRDDGATIILITHKLDEVMQVSENVTVMRHGETVARMVTSETTPAALARAMVGREVRLSVESSELRAERGAAAALDVATALEVRNLVVRGARVERAVNDVSLSVAPGEILGIAGVEGNGQTELIEAIAGLRAGAVGAVLLGGHDVTRASVRARGDAGLSHIPEDRHQRGLILEYSVADNLILGQQHRYAKRGVLDRDAILANALRQIAAYDIRPTNPALPAGALSGGNQQKIVIARELSRPFVALLAAQPTRGVDVGAIEFIHDELRRARDAGKAVLLVSAELREILSLSNRIAVMYGGRIVAVMPRSEASEEVLGYFMTGVSREAVA